MQYRSYSEAPLSISVMQCTFRCYSVAVEMETDDPRGFGFLLELRRNLLNIDILKTLLI